MLIIPTKRNAFKKRGAAYAAPKFTQTRGQRMAKTLSHRADHANVRRQFRLLEQAADLFNCRRVSSGRQVTAVAIACYCLIF